MAAGISLNAIGFTLSYQSGSYVGYFDAQATITGTDDVKICFGLAAGYTSVTGWFFKGQTLEPIDIGDIIASLASDFGIPSSDVPAPILSMELVHAELTLQTGKKGENSGFGFECEGTLTLDDQPLDLVVNIGLQPKNGAYEASFGGKLTIDGLIFEIEFDSDPTEEMMAASYSHQEGKDEIHLSSLVSAVSNGPR